MQLGIPIYTDISAEIKTSISNVLDLKKKCICTSQEFTEPTDDFKSIQFGSCDFHTCFKSLSPTDNQQYLCSSVNLAFKKIPSKAFTTWHNCAFCTISTTNTSYFSEFLLGITTNPLQSTDGKKALRQKHLNN